MWMQRARGDGRVIFSNRPIPSNLIVAGSLQLGTDPRLFCKRTAELDSPEIGEPSARVCS